jgi:hypothetical protein
LEIAGLVARWARFASVLAVVGAVVFRLIVLRRAAVGSTTVVAATRHVATLAAMASAVIAISAVAWLTFQTADMRFPDEPWLEVATRLVTQTTWGTVWIVHIVTAVLLIAAFTARGAVVQAMDRRRSWRRSRGDVDTSAAACRPSASRMSASSRICSTCSGLAWLERSVSCSEHRERRGARRRQTLRVGPLRVFAIARRAPDWLCAAVWSRRSPIYKL